MTLFELAIKNIKHNIKSYGLYIGSTIFSIMIYFTFVTLKFNEEISALSEVSKRISGIMNASSFVLMFFVAIFIAYSNSFFMKKRKKEIALYSLMGVRKRSIGWMLFFENMVIGFIALVAGIVLGFLLSQLLLSLLLKLMGMNIVLDFAFSMNAIVNTIQVFLIIFFVASLLGYRIIYRFKLIDLFYADKKGEELPKARTIAALFGIITLAGAYWLALQDLGTSEVWRLLGIALPLVVIALTILGSYFIFNSVLIYSLRVMKRRKTWAWKDLNLLSISQMLYRIRGNARTLTIIAILSATTITAGGAVFGLYYNVEKNVQQYTPFTFMWEGEKQSIDASVVKYYEKIHSKTVRVLHDGNEREYRLLDYSTFSKLARQLGRDDIGEAPDEGYVWLVDAFYDERISSQVNSVHLDQEIYDVSKLYELPVFNVMTMGGTALILADQQYAQIVTEEGVYQAVQVKDYKNQALLSEQLSAKTANFSSAVEDYRESIEATGSMLFVGSFLGLVFLVATGSIIFFKTMTEAEEDKSKYVVLHKIGVSKKEMKRSIRYQVGIIFVAPLLLGLLHGGVALVAFSNLLLMNLWIPIVFWMLGYTVIYIIYYFASVRGVSKTTLNTLGGN